jgi:Cu(I)/Ag(I) efflux system membrane fusion protein
MQAMMGRIGMADWQMRGAYEAKMDDMKNMPGMKSEPGKPVSETRQVSGFSLNLSTVPDKPKAGENVLRLTLADKAGKAISNAQVFFIYTMPMPGMTDTKATAIYKDGFYEGKAMLDMNGTWDITVLVTIPGKPPIKEKFSLQVGATGKTGVSAPAGHGKNSLPEQAGGGRVRTSGEKE